MPSLEHQLSQQFSDIRLHENIDESIVEVWQQETDKDNPIEDMVLIPINHHVEQKH